MSACNVERETRRSWERCPLPRSPGLWRKACPLQQLCEPPISAYVLEERVTAEPADEYLSPIVGIVKPSEALVEVAEPRIDEGEHVSLNPSAVGYGFQLLG